MFKLKNFYLNVNQKMKLIEILLIVGSILAAFKIPSDMIWLFMIFILFSILYYIHIQQKKVGHLELTSIFVSASFVGIITYNFAVSVITAAPNYFDFWIIVTLIYYFLFTGLLYRVLTNKRNL